MTKLRRWQVSNDQYLGAALNWLRLRLRWLAQSVEMQQEKNSQSSQPEIRWEEIEQAENLMAVADCHPPPALILLSYKLGLSKFEQWVLLLCVAMEFDTSIANLCAEAQDHPNRPY